MVSQATLDAAQASSTSSIGTIDVNNLGGGGLQLMFAKLQLSLAESAKSNAMNYIQDIQKTQEEQKQLAALLQQARQLQADAKGGTGNASGDNHASLMPQEMQDYLDKNGLAYDKTGNDNRHNKDEWEVAITSLQARMDALGTDTQQKMVFVQDYMGQYNSYLQGANSVIQQSNQTLSELARAR
ncbi:MAG: hypothetical protein LBB55_02110 [Zoogloeaceae bacterium]|jgi:pantothenate kinase-related protein Tda10|nr:hypothetical protein [Zoogloeaceae bacterium]